LRVLYSFNVSTGEQVKFLNLNRFRFSLDGLSTDKAALWEAGGDGVDGP
jgi:hypothetical protein